jgi:hypothetical protein
MKIPSLLLSGFLAAGVLTMPASTAQAQVQDYRSVYKHLTELHAGAVVTVKFVMSVTASGKEERIEDRTQALLVSSDGLLLVPDRAVSIDFRQFSGAGKAQGAAPVAKSSEFRVRLAGSDDWLPADLVTRDTQLGLAWLRLRSAPAAKLAFVDLDHGIRAEPGMTFFSLMRTSDEWGGVPVFREGFVMGETHTPKTLLLVDGVPGMAFSAEGEPMGYVDIDFAKLMRTRSGNGGLGLDMADSALQMTPIAKVAAATHMAEKLPSVAASK